MKDNLYISPSFRYDQHFPRLADATKPIVIPHGETCKGRKERFGVSFALRCALLGTAILQVSASHLAPRNDGTERIGLLAGPAPAMRNTRSLENAQSSAAEEIIDKPAAAR